MGNKFANINEAVAFLDAIPQFTGAGTTFSCGRDRARLLLKCVGSPEKGLNIIHIAGSNGKGSVCALLECALRSAGLKTGLFTSPHLSCVRERIRLCGEMIGENTFTRLINAVYEAQEQIRKEYTDFQAAYFEYFFVAALLYYRELGADVVILETGLGGRLDATNACENKALCVITPISLEHTQILGDDLGSIAAEKAGIIAKGVPVVAYKPEDAKALAAFLEAAEARSASLHLFDPKQVRVNVMTDENVDFSIDNEYYRNVTVTLGVPAIYEAYNAGLALTALAVLAETEVVVKLDQRRLQIALPEILEKLKAWEWQGRMQRLSKGVYVDGAHNADGIRAFLESVAAFARDKENVLLFAVSDDKDKTQMVRLLCESGLFKACVVTSADEVRGASVAGVAELFRAQGMADVRSCEDVAAAASEATCIAHEYLFCTGSLFLAGKVARMNIR